MARIALKDRLKQGVFFLDGAMGTQLQAAGAPMGCCSDYLCIESPEIVKTVHRNYIEAGADAVITNTFGANAITLKRHGYADKVYQITNTAAKLARQVVGEEKYVIGDIGPCGDFLEPLGMLKEADLKAAFAEQATGLLDGGVDGFIVETMSAIEETQVAVEAIKSVCELPIFATQCYDPAGEEMRTMMGLSPERAVEELVAMGVTAVGFNCGTLDMAGYVQLAKTFAAALADTDVLLIAEPNAGKPELEDGQAVYKLTAEDYADAMVEINAAGATILGGCCGTTPGHITAAVKKIC